MGTLPVLSQKLTEEGTNEVVVIHISHLRLSSGGI